MIPSSQSPLSVSDRLQRARRVGATFGRVYVGIKTNQLIARYLAPPDMRRRWTRLHLDSARSIYRTAVDLRGIILKGCQYLGARADVLPPEYVRVLSKLQDRVPPKSFRVVQATVERELRRPLESVFESFASTPIASASLAQVHEARLRSGERVAVKVQYPEIAALVRSDLSNLRALFRAVGFIERDFALMPLLDELAATVPRELDFVNEAHNAEHMKKHFEGRDDVYVPTIYWDHTTRRVLVMEFIEGIKINDSRALREAGLATDQVMQTLLDAYCEQILVRGFFHADPHPGNLMVQPVEERREAEVSPSPGWAKPPGSVKPRIVFLDFGLAKTLPVDFRKDIVSFAAALLGDRPDQMAKALIDLGFETRETPLSSLQEIARAVLDAAHELRDPISMGGATARTTKSELPRLIRENPVVRVPAHILLIARVITLLSGLSRSLEVKVDMTKTVLPYALGLREASTSR